MVALLGVLLLRCTAVHFLTHARAFASLCSYFWLFVLVPAELPDSYLPRRPCVSSSPSPCEPSDCSSGYLARPSGRKRAARMLNTPTTTQTNSTGRWSRA